MSLNEFSLIDRYFRPLGLARNDVLVGIGDDAAVLSCGGERELVVAVDTLVEGVHFPVGTKAGDVAYKSLAVNLSDFAAMGAQPAWATLALTLPSADETWLQEFAQGWVELARAYGVALVGGDTTRGPLTVSVQLMGFVPPGRAVKRSGAKPGNLIFVSGTLGDACGGLRCIVDDLSDDADAKFLRDRLNRPVARVQLGAVLRDVATAMIDVSDGLAADLGHIVQHSGCGARIRLSDLPLSPALQRIAPCISGAPRIRGVESISAAQACALAGGDDYELCFTAAPDMSERLAQIGRSLNCTITAVGEIVEGAPLTLELDTGAEVAIAPQGFQHF